MIIELIVNSLYSVVSEFHKENKLRGLLVNKFTYREVNSLLFHVQYEDKPILRTRNLRILLNLSDDFTIVECSRLNQIVLFDRFYAPKTLVTYEAWETFPKIRKHKINFKLSMNSLSKEGCYAPQAFHQLNPHLNIESIKAPYNLSLNFLCSILTRDERLGRSRIFQMDKLSIRIRNESPNRYNSMAIIDFFKSLNLIDSTSSQENVKYFIGYL